MSERPEVSPGEEIRSDVPEDRPEQPLNATSEAAAEPASEHGPLADVELERLRMGLEARKREHDALHDKYIRLHAEFDNFRKRTAKERMELLMSAGAEAIQSMLPVLDDMDRAIAHNAEVNDITAVKQGFTLIQQKFVNILMAHGVKDMPAKGQAFDPELHDAISQVPAPEPKMKGMVLDVVEKGYLLNEKVLRHAKVVVGQ